MKPEHVMVDLETADNIPTAAIISIGAAVFSTDVPEADWPKFYRAVDLGSAIAAGLTVGDGTMSWWARQAPEARAVFDDPARVQLADALVEFSVFVARRRDARVWGNGASFDNAILATAYAACGLEVPWKFWNDRCYRTAVAGRPKRQQQGTHHNALDDVLSQANHIIQVAPEAIR